jgi:hypothetical protein
VNEDRAMNDLDGDLAPFAALLVALTDLEPEERAEDDVTISAIRLDLPIELAVRAEDSVVASTPSQHVETTVLPAFHRLQVTLARTAELSSHG